MNQGLGVASAVADRGPAPIYELQVARRTSAFPFIRMNDRTGTP
jgi:hypothetical protein